MLFVQKIIVWIKKLIRSLSKQHVTQQTSTSSLEHQHPQAQISYSEHLITDLKQEHQDLLRMYIAIQNLVESQNYQQAVDELIKFKEAFSRHLMQENVKFYSYFDHHFSTQSFEHQTIKSYRKEMNQIALAVIQFLKKWTQAEALDQQSSVKFLEEYTGIASALSQRIADEEKELYVLYHAI